MTTGEIFPGHELRFIIDNFLVYSAGANVVAIVVPLSGLVLVALLLVGVFFYCRR